MPERLHVVVVKADVRLTIPNGSKVRTADILRCQYAAQGMNDRFGDAAPQ